MSTNPFHSKELLKSVSNYPVSKGDEAGHPFRGNQYTSGEASDFARDHTQTGDFAADKGGNENYSIAEKHYAAARAWQDVANGKGNEADAIAASKAANELSNGRLGVTAGPEEETPSSPNQTPASSVNVGGTTWTVGGKPVAKSDNFHTAALLKSASNYPVSKGGPGSGAQPGHPFLGNQYTGGGKIDFHQSQANFHSAKAREGGPLAGQHQSSADWHSRAAALYASGNVKEGLHAEMEAQRLDAEIDKVQQLMGKDDYAKRAADIAKEHALDSWSGDNDSASRAAEWSEDHAGEIQPTEEHLRAVADLHDKIAGTHESNDEAYQGDPSEYFGRPVDVSGAVDANRGVADKATALADRVASGGTVSPDEMNDLRGDISDAAAYSHYAAVDEAGGF